MLKQDVPSCNWTIAVINFMGVTYVLKSSPPCGHMLTFLNPSPILHSDHLKGSNKHHRRSFKYSDREGFWTVVCKGDSFHRPLL